MALPETHVQDVCRIGQGAECCSFLFVDGDGIHCAKGTGVLEDSINLRRAAGTLTAMGDNCPGMTDEGVPLDSTPSTQARRPAADTLPGARRARGA